MMLFRRQWLLLVARCEVAGHDKPSKAYIAAGAMCLKDETFTDPAGGSSAAPLKSVDHEMLPCHEHVRLDGEIAHNAGDVLGLAEASHGNPGG